MNEIVKMGIDLYRGNVQKYSNEEADSKLRNALRELTGSTDGQINFKKFRKHKTEIFELLEETLEVLVAEGLQDQFMDFAEVRNLKLGDKNIFRIPNTDLYDIAVVADGHGNHLRQRIKDDQDIAVPVKTYSIKIYEEFHRFLAGKINWVDMINRISQSFLAKLRNDIYAAIYDSYNQLNAPYKESAKFSLEKLTDIAAHVETQTQSDVIILGTKKALSKISPAQLSDRMKDEFNATGFFGRVAGYDLHEIKQSHKRNTHEFAVNDDFLLVIPTSIDKFVKIVNEGEAIVQDVEGGKNADLTLEYDFTMKQGILVATSSQYGIFRIA